MGFIPIFVTLGGFVFLFIIVVSTSIKNKRLQFQQSFEHLKNLLTVNEDLPATRENLSTLEKVYLQNKQADPSQSKIALAQAKLHLYQYNTILKKKPYSFVAAMIGHQPI